MEGFIQLHRKMIEWEWYDDINTKVLFIHLLIKANWKDKKWRWIDIKRWEFLTSLWKLSEETQLSVQQVRTSLNKLESTREVTKKWQASYTIIKLNNYDGYQTNNTEYNKPITNEQQTSNKPVTTTNKNNNINKDNKEISIVETKVSHTLKDLMLETLNKESFINEYNSSEDVIKKEMMKFYLYWSEKKPNWKKELWEMQKTFDVSRRFHKWLDNNSKWNKNTEPIDRSNLTLEEKEQILRDKGLF